MGTRRTFWGKYRVCLHEYANKTFVHGCRHSVEEGRSTREKCLWTLLILGMIVATIWLLSSSYVSFSRAPTTTSRSVNRVPINTIPFPAVAICSGTRISREALRNYADFIFSVQNFTYSKISKTYEEVFEHLLHLGSFYTLNIDQDNFYVYDRLHSFFMEVYGNPYPIKEIMAKLTPSCETFLKRCFWNGEERNCSKIFKTNRTDYGPCCTFNYQRLPSAVMAELSQDGIDIPSHEPLYVKDSEFKDGLTVVIDQNSSDQAYNIASTMAARVLVFHPQDYPDMASNAYTERPVYFLGELFVEIFPESIKGDDAMHHVSAKVRGCIFRDENMLIYKGFYTFSECQLACRLNDIIRFCGCSPHQYSNIYNTSQCLLSDVSCLIKWKNKWDNSEPYLLDAESQYIGVQCSHCMPTCNYIKYDIRSNFGMLDAVPPTDFLNEIHPIDKRHLSVVHVHFALPYATEYHQTIVSTWYDLVATLGGLAGFTIGASLLSVVEFIWYYSGKLGTLWLTKSPEEQIIGLPQIYITDFKIDQKKFSQFSHQRIMKNK